jgi:uncharacterized membrane protein
MTGEILIVAFTVVLAIMPFISAASTVFLWGVYFSDRKRPRSWVLFHLAIGATVASFIAISISLVAILRSIDMVTGPTSGALQILLVLLLELVPIWYGVAVWRMRRSRDYPIPPFSDR